MRLQSRASNDRRSVNPIFVELVVLEHHGQCSIKCEAPWPRPGQGAKHHLNIAEQRSTASEPSQRRFCVHFTPENHPGDHLRTPRGRTPVGNLPKPAFYLETSAEHVREFEYCGRNAAASKPSKSRFCVNFTPRITLATICEHHVGGGPSETFPSQLFILKPLCSAEHVREFEYSL